MKTMKIGVIGCGNISAAYFKNLKQYAILEVAACADLVLERARARAGEFGIPRACGVAELLADPELELVVNLTLPKAHAEIAEAALP
ncbi:MAG: Gfo/Idh/MocA family oxidoreductase, partial [Lentisphaerae bacterium]|nr:Gfo/Idh/MocA family oxidoreductase [Lentisphaerota bacterium]